jgi:hypothetical protein
MSLQSLNTKLGLVLPAFVVSLILAGCGGGDVDPVFVTPDPPDGVPVVTFLGDASAVALGGSTQLAVQLDKRAQQNIDVRFFVQQFRNVDPVSVDDTDGGDSTAVPVTGSFIVPATVRVQTNQSVGVFQVSTTGQTHVGDTVTIRIVPGAAYVVGTDDSLEVTAVAALGSVSLVGPDLTVQAGEGFWYSIQRNECQDEITVPLAVTGDVDCFDVPASVTLPAGACSVAFSSVAGECSDGSIGISVLPPSGLGLEPYGFITLQSGSISGVTSADSSKATVTLGN